ncbi:hypothetical protein PT974_07668 [Cladobotryum mycophilum]|uniref:Uncharacterized protein n=1 Tax=Cladobotryum mycophilum TaxID=491253 RepID=A0ABR0SPW6_9HYPO
MVSNHDMTVLDQDEDVIGLISEKPSTACPQKASWGPFLLQIALTFILSLTGSCVLYYLLATHQQTTCRCVDGFEHGHSTEFGPVLPYISVKIEQSTGGLTLSSNGTLKLGTSMYSGRPSSQIDQAWVELLVGNEIVVFDKEASSMKGKTMREEDGGGDPEHYGINAHNAHKTHLDHCVDYLRQTIQCHSDLTPVPYWIEPETGSRTVNFGELHTCRDFGKLHEWVIPRYRSPTRGV